MISAKQVMATLILPLAAFATKVQNLKRVWAYARIRCQLPGKVDHSLVIFGVPEIHGSGRIFLGRHLLLYRELYLETREEGEIHLADNVVLSRGVHLVAFSRIEIGDSSMVGEYTSIRDADHGFGDGLSVRHSGHTSQPILIGRNSWIGRGVTILGGVTIGDNCVVGANAVVTCDVPSGTVVAGIPARPLKRDHV